MSLDPITLQVMVGALRAACDEMGVVLVRSAHSANIKERRDASTGLFDAEGQMVMQAEHIPVHLGAMPASVEAVLDEEHSPGDAWILNDPYRGGTHLPDITVVSPLFVGDELAGFAASRAHHADVGSAVPGSLPVDSRTLEDEGVVISADAARARGRARPRAARRADLADARRRASARPTCAPSSPPTAPGGERLAALAERHGLDTLRAAMSETLDYAERRTRARIEELEDGEREATDVLEAPDEDLELHVRATVKGDELELDFSGSADQYDGNLNCPLAVTLSASYFALRVLTDPDVPPCAGAYRPLTVTVPEGSLLNARPPAAVVAGNTETSSRVADLVLKAFGRALGQGTMNNVALGNDDFTYYETLGGGQGACPDADGPSAVHVAMSNTLNTPRRGARARVPAAGGRVRGASRLGRGRQAPRRRRRDPGARGARGDELLAGDRAPAARAAGRRGWRIRALPVGTC